MKSFRESNIAFLNRCGVPHSPPADACAGNSGNSGDMTGIRSSIPDRVPREFPDRVPGEFPHLTEISHPMTIVNGARFWPLVLSLAEDIPYHCKILIYEPDSALYAALFDTADFRLLPPHALAGVFSGPVEVLRAPLAGFSPGAVRILPVDAAPSLRAAVARFYLEDARAFYSEAQALLDACAGGVGIEGAELCERMIAHIAAAHAAGRNVPTSHRALLTAIDMLTRVTREELGYD